MCTNCIVKYKNKCYLECPKDTCIKQDDNLDTCIDIDINTKVINQICFENFQNISSNIKKMSDNNIIINSSPNLTVYGYEIEKDVNYFEENNLTYIYFKDIKETLIKNYNLNEDSNIYVLLVESASKYSNSTINDYGFVLLLENGTELNLSYLNDELKVNISIPIVNLDLAKFNYAKIFYEQGYDIYNKYNNFYHDTCTPGYLGDNDLTLKDRKKEIFINNISIGKTNCEYQLTDLLTKRFIFNCYLYSVNENNTNNNEKNYFPENYKDNLMNYILDAINYKILICSSLFFNIDNYRHNKAIIICTGYIFISTFLFILFFCRGFSKIRILMYNELPTDKKIRKLLIENQRKNKIILSNSNPLKKK